MKKEPLTFEYDPLDLDPQTGLLDKKYCVPSIEVTSKNDLIRGLNGYYHTSGKTISDVILVNQGLGRNVETGKEVYDVLAQFQFQGVNYHKLYVGSLDGTIEGIEIRRNFLEDNLSLPKKDIIYLIMDVPVRDDYKCAKTLLDLHLVGKDESSGSLYWIKNALVKENRDSVKYIYEMLAKEYGIEFPVARV